jgi:hypothetical protein
MIFSECPRVYPLAVSMKLPPRSMNAASIASDSPTVAPHPHSSPKVIAPRQNGLTRNPERPSVT